MGWWLSNWSEGKYINRNDRAITLVKQLQLFSMPDEVLKLNDEEITREYEPCLDTSISSVELEASHWQQSNLGEYRQPSLWKSTPTLNSSLDTNSQKSQSTQTSLATNPTQENSTSSQWDSPAQAHQTQEAEQDSNTQHPHGGREGLRCLSEAQPKFCIMEQTGVKIRKLP